MTTVVIGDVTFDVSGGTTEDQAKVRYQWGQITLKSLFPPPFIRHRGCRPADPATDRSGRS